MTTFQLEAVERWQADAKDLIYAHWQELGLDLDLEIAPAYEKMKQLENLGAFKVITARSEGRLVGYLLAIFSPHLHYSKAAPMFIVDAYYIAPDFRRGMGAQMIRFAESEAKRLGAIKVYLSCKVHQDHSKLFEALGYTLSDFAFIKRI
jgi:GNAT superfamily N-acetyltransferase